jgi:hypothetical protein
MPRLVDWKAVDLEIEKMAIDNNGFFEQIEAQKSEKKTYAQRVNLRKQLNGLLGLETPIDLPSHDLWLLNEFDVSLLKEQPLDITI